MSPDILVRLWLGDSSSPPPKYQVLRDLTTEDQEFHLRLLQTKGTVMRKADALY
ncbi:uncharacterized protein FIBRA_09591 [Fibroporia radiculosa]|uniref:Uncharacterized protein n=1 Tax=Fibroporia radiculosa TaxID=599839 RepID=J7RWD2_9APHY|nr:uncharacterized protein FIBRA_09591 [Fibroporia radiculosa]CCM07245.1 predicted protein [Fibroporia radiculosa]